MMPKIVRQIIAEKYDPLKYKHGKSMFISKEDYANYFTSDGFQRVQTLLGNVRRGQPKIWTAPFAGEEPIDKVIDDWKVELESIRDEWPSLWDFENDLASKVGPLSVQKPLRERMDDIAHYWDDILLQSQPIDSAAINAAISEFAPITPVHVRSQKRTVDLMKLSSNSGNPDFTKRRDVRRETTPVAIDYWFSRRKPNVHMLLKGGHRAFLGAAVVGWRGQEGGPNETDVKQRVIWMFPFALNIEELTVYQPLIEGAQHRNLIPAWVSMDSVDREITLLFDSKSDDDLVVCTDFSKFDQHFNKDMQYAAKSILAAILAKTHDARKWLDQVFDCKYCIPLCISADKHDTITIVSGEHGMASGSGGTNVDETLAHRALQYEAAMSQGQELNPHSQCLGDDGILTYPGITVDKVVAAYQSHGQECNVSKQYASTQDCVYLRRWHHKDYRINGVCPGVYSTCRAIGRLRYLERFMDPDIWSPEMVALRQLSIIENCKWHPLFEQFIQFCMKRDKFRLGLDIPGFLDNITRIASEATEYMPDFLGYTKTLQGEGAEGIAGWEVVKYLLKQPKSL